MLKCHTEAQQSLYERGYPYIAELVDGHKDDKKPEVSASKAFKDYFGVYHVKWPRLTATAFARGGKGTEPLSPDEARKIIDARFATKDTDNWNADVKLMCVLEALTSTEVVLDALVNGIENLSKSRWKGAHEDGNPAMLAYISGFLLLRAKTPKKFRDRLETIYTATVKAKIAEGEESLRGALDLALHGNAGAARALANSHWQYWYYYLNVDDAAVHKARLADNWKSDWVPESRILFLAGEEMLPIYTSKKALRQGKRLERILEDFSMFEHEGVITLMTDMIGVKSAGDVPKNYFTANASYVTPRLEKIARGNSASAVKAKMALSMIG